LEDPQSHKTPPQLTTRNPKQYTAAAKTSTLDPTARALDALLRAFKSDPHLATILRAPSLTPSDRSQIVEQLLKTSEAGSDKAADTIKGFMKTLAENNRLSALEGVCEKFQTLMGAHRGEVELRVTSAAPLDTRVLRQLEQAVGRSQYVGQGKKLKVVPRVCAFSFSCPFLARLLLPFLFP